ncbi:MAG: hypothetical protein FWD53_04485 [Phycisphaerales bacterium]|nr:hypothetical protein [Phycisphaerales bacterium]
MKRIVLIVAILLATPTAYGELTKLWMSWDVARPDVGRTTQAPDPLTDWSANRVIADRVALRAAPTPPSTETIPMPIAPGSRVTGFEIPPETFPAPRH